MRYHGRVSNLFLSAIVYVIPFWLSYHFWWLIFLFPIPLLYIIRTQNLSFMHGYIWGCIVFALHLSGGIYLVADMAGESWPVGLILGIVMVLYQALVPAFLFWCTTRVITVFSITSPIARLLLWTAALWLFIIWVDWYSLSVFGVQEGYPLMHPLIVLANKPELLYLLPIIGKQLLTALFLLVPVSIVLLLWHGNYAALLFMCAIALFMNFFLIWGPRIGALAKSGVINTLPCMVCSTAQDPTVVIKIIGNQIKKMIAQYPNTEIIIMPESACNVSNFESLSELLQLWNKDNVGKAVHIIFGASRWQNDHYYNSLHWVYDGTLQRCYDKKHAMLLSERLSPWMNNDFFKRMYFNERQPIATSLCERVQLVVSDDISFVPYICSELFFTELPDDMYENVPILAVINDLLFATYIQKLLVLLARFKAMQWQRDIIYVSYTQSLFIDK
jgi:apolipoprotein N-acyltransferase